MTATALARGKQPFSGRTALIAATLATASRDERSLLAEMGRGGLSGGAPLGQRRDLLPGQRDGGRRGLATVLGLGVGLLTLGHSRVQNVASPMASRSIVPVCQVRIRTPCWHAQRPAGSVSDQEQR